MSADFGDPRTDAADAAPAGRWRVVSHGSHDGAWNMALDEAIARAVGAGQAPPTVRFYTWNLPTISLGCLQPAGAAVTQEACSRRGIQVVRRPTGGRAVLHDDELTYSVCVPLDGFWSRLSVAESFRVIGAGLAVGLQRLGVAASLGASGGTLGGRDAVAACFQTPRMPAVLAAGKKLIGSAQRRWETALLQHGSLLLSLDLEMHLALFPAWPRDDPAKGVTWLKALFPEVPRRCDVERALLGGWAEVLHVRGQPGDLAGSEWNEAERLVAARYGNPAWTWRY